MLSSRKWNGASLDEIFEKDGLTWLCCIAAEYLFWNIYEESISLMFYPLLEASALNGL